MDFGALLFAVIAVIVGMIGVVYFGSIGLIYIVKKVLFINYENDNKK